MPVVLHINRLIFDKKKENKASYRKDDCPRDKKNIKNIKSCTHEELEKKYNTLVKDILMMMDI